jgi:hypothetical protein
MQRQLRSEPQLGERSGRATVDQSPRRRESLSSFAVYAGHVPEEVLGESVSERCLGDGSAALLTLDVMYPLIVVFAIVLTSAQAFVQTGTRDRIRAFPWLLAGSSIVLVHLQLLWLLARVRPNESFRHLNQTITLQGLQQGCLAALLFSASLWVGLPLRHS